MKHEFKEGDGVVCSSNREANEILQLLIKNGYSHNDRRTNDICLEYWRDRGGKLTFIGANESDTTFTNKIPKEEFIKLITGESKYTKEYCIENNVLCRINNPDDAGIWLDFMGLPKDKNGNDLFLTPDFYQRNTDVCLTMYGGWSFFEYYKEHEREIINISDLNIKTKNTMTKERKLSRENFKRIYSYACNTWKSMLELKFKDFSFKDEIIIEESYYQKMRKACNYPQHKLFDEIFGEDDNLITGADLNMGEAMLVTEEGHYKDSLVFKSTGQGIFLNSTRQIGMGQFSSNEYLALKGKKVKLNISYEVIN